MSSDPNDPMPLSPSSLLNMKESPVSAPPTGAVFCEADTMSYGKRRWRRVQYLADKFWMEWRLSYLQLLQHRRKWLSRNTNLEPDDVVLLRDKSCPRKSWPMGVVVAVRKSKDGLVRSATIKTCTSFSSKIKTSMYERPVTDLVVLIRRSSCHTP